MVKKWKWFWSATIIFVTFILISVDAYCIYTDYFTAVGKKKKKMQIRNKETFIKTQTTNVNK